MKHFHYLIMTVAGLLALAQSAMAVPSRPGTHTFKNPDGTSITLMRVGDENFHTYVTTDGLTVARANDGFFHYRTKNGITSMRASDPAERTAAETDFLNASGNGAFTVKSLAASQYSTITSRRKSAAAVRHRAYGMTRTLTSQVPQTGSPRIPVLLVQYSDYKFKDSNPEQVFNNFFETGEKSARQYFVDQSNGRYTPQFDVYGPVTLPNNRAHYGGNDAYGNDKRVCTMVGEACERLDSKINFRDYDNNGDGECDVVIVLYAGDGEASSYEDDCEDAVWPCQWGLSAEGSDFSKGALTLDGTRVDLFAVFNELNGMDLKKIDGVGTFCHEFSHCLGLPDFYDTQYGPHFGMACWSLMDAGSYNDDGYTPISYSAYEKNFMGWIELPEAKENTLYTLPVMNLKSADTDKAVKITNDADKDEYFILENRAKQGWDKFMPTEGLMISHVTYNERAWIENYVNDYDMQRMTLVPADGELQLDKTDYFGEIYYDPNEEGLLGDLWPWNDSKDFTDESTPPAKVNTGKYLSKPVTEITRNDDGTISFWAMKAPLPSLETPDGLSHTLLSDSSALISWTQSDSQSNDYQLQVWPHRDITWSLIYDEDFTSEGEWSQNWDTAGFTEVTEEGLRFGSNKQNGILISPAFDLEGNEEVTVSFTAKTYGNDTSSIVISVLDEKNNELDSETISLTSSYTPYSVVLAAPTTENVTVWFQTEEKRARFYLKNAQIYAGDASEEISKALANGTRVSTPEDLMEFIVKGANSYKVEGLKAGLTYDYRLRTLSPDETAFNHSAWTATQSFDLSTFNAIRLPMLNPNDESEARYFNLQGYPVVKPLVPGIYIRCQGNRTDKIVIK